MSFKLLFDERGNALDRLEVLHHELFGGNGDLEPVLQVRDQLQHAQGIEDAALQEGIGVHETPHPCPRELANDESPDPLSYRVGWHRWPDPGKPRSTIPWAEATRSPM